MIYLKAPGQGILVLGSQRRAVDLLDKRAANYSDRPYFPISELQVEMLIKLISTAHAVMFN